MTKDAFTIIIPTYNQAGKTHGLLNSLREQMGPFPQTKVLVIDDGGNQDLSFVKDYPFATLIRKRNGGAASARNKGLDNADTEYIAFLDGDDEIYSNYLETIYKDMREGYVWVSYDWHCDGLKERAEQRLDEPLMINCAVWAYCYRSDLIGDKRFVEKMVLAEDQEWLKRVLRDDVKHKHSSDIFYNYLWNGNDNSVVHRYLRGELGEEREDRKFMLSLKNVMCVGNINSIGGIESMLYYLAKKYAKNYDITVVYKTGAVPQLDRLKKMVRVIKWKPELTIKCEKVFCNLDTSFLENIEADEYYQIIHADYKAYKIKHYPHPDVQHYLGVSENTCKTFKEVSGLDITICHNPIVLDKPRKVLHLISATRMTWEKGKERMAALAGALDAAGIPYTWEVFTDSPEKIQNPNILYRPPKLDITDYIADADYLVQLSNTEGWSYAIYEALCLNVPVITTDFPSIYEMGVVSGKNGFILSMDMSNIPVDAIYKGVEPFTYKPVPDGYGKLLAKGKSNYEEEVKALVKVKCTNRFYDLETSVNREVGDTWETSFLRADHLEDLHLVKIVGG